MIANVLVHDIAGSAGLALRDGVLGLSLEESQAAFNSDLRTPAVGKKLAQPFWRVAWAYFGGAEGLSVAQGAQNGTYLDFLGWFEDYWTRISLRDRYWSPLSTPSVEP